MKWEELEVYTLYSTKIMLIMIYLKIRSNTKSCVLNYPDITIKLGVIL